MKKLNITYWIFTGLFAALMIFSAIPDLMVTPEAIGIVSTLLGYPQYFIIFVGVAKLLGGIAIVIPGFPRIKEWAYAGLMYDLIAAAYSMIAIGAPLMNWVFMLLPIALGTASYLLYHKRLKATSAQ